MSASLFVPDTTAAGQLLSSNEGDIQLTVYSVVHFQFSSVTKDSSSKEARNPATTFATSMPLTATTRVLDGILTVRIVCQPPGRKEVNTPSAYNSTSWSSVVIMSFFVSLERGVVDVELVVDFTVDIVPEPEDFSVVPEVFVMEVVFVSEPVRSVFDVVPVALSLELELLLTFVILDAVELLELEDLSVVVDVDFTMVPVFVIVPILTVFDIAALIALLLELVVLDTDVILFVVEVSELEELSVIDETIFEVVDIFEPGVVCITVVLVVLVIPPI